MRVDGLGVRRIVWSAAVAVMAIFAALSAGAHDPISSIYTYNDDVFPVVKAQCGSCHVAGGIAPMSLLTYNDASPWAASIKQEVMHLRMPPALADSGFGPIRQAPAPSAREMDILLDWASGGTPEGEPSRKPAPVALKNEWPLGRPDLILQMPAPHVLGPDIAETVHEFVLETRLTSDRSVRAIDLLPGTPAIVRDATIYLGPIPIARWLPGDRAPAAPEPAAFRLPAGADLKVRIHYRKTWTYEGTAMTDRSAVGLYFHDRPASVLRSIPLAADAPRGEQAPVLVVSQMLDADLDAFGVFPEAAPINAVVTVQAVLPGGARVPMLQVQRDRPDWERRYWFERPLRLPRGTRLEVTARPLLLDEAASTAEPVIPTPGAPPGLKVWVDVAAPSPD